jgi:hypothetical protein
MGLTLVIILAAFGPLGGKIDTIAGTGQPGYSGDGGLAIRARLHAPFHCDLDSRDNLYIADALNHCVRKVDLKTGIITTVAGSGQSGYSSDGGPARRATFHEPYAVVVHPQTGDLFIVDRLNACVRVVDGRNGSVRTLAGGRARGFAGDGGPATAALLREPNDCCLDGRGGLLIADVADWRIRRVDLETGVITTFAGAGRPAGKVSRSRLGDGGPATKAVLVGPRAVCADSHGAIYICEREGNAVRRVDSQGIITTWAGTGAAGFGGDGGDARRATFREPKGVRCDPSGNVYVVDAENNAVRRIEARTRVVTTIAGGRRGSGGDKGAATEAGLAQPHGCIIDRQGKVYIADTLNNRVRRVSPP